MLFYHAKVVTVACSDSFIAGMRLFPVEIVYLLGVRHFEKYALSPILYIRTQEVAIIAVYIASLYGEPLHNCKQRGGTLTGIKAP